MKKIIFFLFLLIALNVNANNKEVIYQDTITARSPDVSSVDAVIAALYDVISGPAGKARDRNRMRSLFLPEGKLVATGQRPTGELVKKVMTVEDYITNSGPILEKNGFFEKELSRKQEVYGHIAHCFSTYESRKTLTDAEPFMRGINSIQLYYDGKRWWILSVFWQSETKELPIPKEYLNK
jgi:hypothetical protein